MAHKFDPAQMDRLLDPSRRESNDPQYAFDLLKLRSGETLADVGCGPGWFTLPAAQRIGRKGRVYALDIEEQMLERVAERAQQEGLVNIETFVIQEGKAWPLADGSCDAVLLANVLHEVDEQDTFIHELARILRHDGRGLVIDWSPDAPDDVGPPLAHRFSEKKSTDMIEMGGLTVYDRHPVGPYHYGLLFKRKK